METPLDRAAKAIDGLLIMLSQSGVGWDYNSVDDAFAVLIDARRENPALPLAIPISVEVERRMRSEKPTRDLRVAMQRAASEVKYARR